MRNAEAFSHLIPPVQYIAIFLFFFKSRFSIDLANSLKLLVPGLSDRSKYPMSISKSFLQSATKQIGKHRTMIISTGKESSNDSLGKSLSSLWNCYECIKNEGLAVLLAECTHGIGSPAIQRFIEGQMSIDRLKKPSKYVSGMENLLYLTEIQKKFEIGLSSILPDFYLKKLNMTSFSGTKNALEYILKKQGTRQKVAIVQDGARILLKQTN